MGATEARIRHWSERADAYSTLLHPESLFARLAGRLVDRFLEGRLDRDPDAGPFAGRVLDLAAGTGLATRVLLERCPGARVAVAEPAPRMLELARGALGERVEAYHDASCEGLDAVPGTFDLVLCNAAFHLFEDLRSSLQRVARRLEPGRGRLMFNLWGHAVEELREPEPPWRAALDRAAEEAGVRLPEPGPRRGPWTWTARRPPTGGSGLVVDPFPADSDRVPLSFFVDFVETDPGFLPELEAGTRRSLFQRARDLAHGGCAVRTMVFAGRRDAD